MRTEELIFAGFRRSGFPEQGKILLAGCDAAFAEKIRAHFPGADIRTVPADGLPEPGEPLRLAIYAEGLPAGRPTEKLLKALYRHVVPDGLLILQERFDGIAPPEKRSKKGSYLNELLRAARKAGFNPEFRLLGGQEHPYLVTLKRHAIPQAKALQVYMNTVSQYLIDHG